jgi:hypothetical protein
MLRNVIVRSLLFAALAASATYLARILLHTDQYLDDLGGLNNFVGVFGTLYGILAAFVVFEVWLQYNRTSELIDKEAQALERLYRLTLYFRDDKLTSQMKSAITEYANINIRGNFQQLAAGLRRRENSVAFRNIADIIRHIEFDDDHDSIIFAQILEHYGILAQIRTERQNQSLSRLPILLKSFIYIASSFALATFIIMPFENIYYAMFSVTIIGFLMAMIFHIIEDLDNPFVGHWNLTPEPFARALKHIEEDY